MNCNAFESELRSSIECRDTADRLDLREHAAGCARCGPLLEEQLWLQRAVAAWKEGVPAVDLADGVMARWAFDRGEEPLAAPPVAERDAAGAEQIAQPAAATPAVATAAARRPARPTAWRFGRTIVVAVAIAVLAVLVSPLVWRPGGSPDEGLPPLAGDPREDGARDAPLIVRDDPSNAAGAERPVRLDAAVRDAGSAWLRLANEAGGAVREMAAFLPDRTLAVAIESPEEASDSPAGWTERWQNEVGPIGRDVGKAFGFLREAVSLEPAPTL